MSREKEKGASLCRLLFCRFGDIFSLSYDRPAFVFTVLTFPPEMSCSRKFIVISSAGSKAEFHAVRCQVVLAVSLPLNGGSRCFILTPETQINPTGEQIVELDLDLLSNLISNRKDEIEKSVSGNKYNILFRCWPPGLS